MLHVLVADDHAVVRKGLTHILEDLEQPVRVVEAATGQEALAYCHQEKFDLLLLDIALPDLNGLEVLHQARTLQPDTPVLILSVYPEKQYALHALRAGAAGYLTKDSAPDQLVQAVERLLAGHKYITPELADLLLEEWSGSDGDAPHTRLSEREMQVLCLLGEGRTVSEIADHLHLSVKTISTYRTRVLRKLGLSTTAELIQYAVRHNLVL